MSTTGEIEDLSATVADLKARVEALERELAALRPAPVFESTPRVDIATLWDNASNQEKRWSEEDFA